MAEALCSVSVCRLSTLSASVRLCVAVRVNHCYLLISPQEPGKDDFTSDLLWR